MCVRPSLGIEQYVLSEPSEAVHLFVPPRGLRQLCAKLTAWCGLAEEVYQFNSDAKSIVSVACVHPCTSAHSHFFCKKNLFFINKKIDFLCFFLFFNFWEKMNRCGCPCVCGHKKWCAGACAAHCKFCANFVQFVCRCGPKLPHTKGWQGDNYNLLICNAHLHDLKPTNSMLE